MRPKSIFEILVAHWSIARSVFTRSASIAIAATILTVSAAQIAHAQVAGTVEQGLEELAATIAAKSREAERTTIAVLPFPNADGTCSVLSTYVVDELILALFSLPDTQLDIIERSQLEALIRELQIGEGGLLNPATTKELGNLSGVNALTIGTITVIGDLVRLNARLVATDTGKTLSAAAVTVPKTSALSTLLEQRTPCSTVETTSASGAPNHSVATSSTLTNYEKKGLRLEVVKVKGDGRTIDVVVRVTNVSSEPIKLLHSDSSHQFNNGIVCVEDRYGYGASVSGIASSDNSGQMTEIVPGETAQYVITSIGCASNGGTGPLSSRILLDLLDKNGKTEEVGFQLFDIPYGDSE